MTNKISLQSVDSSFATGAASLSMRSYLSTHQLWAARHFAELAKEIENDAQNGQEFSIKHRSYVIASVLTAVALLESAINELFQDIYDQHTTYTVNIQERIQLAMSAYWRESSGRGSILEKYQVLLGLAGCDILDPGAEPFQSAMLVIKVRNLLVHFKPETASATDERKLRSQLESKFSENKLTKNSGNPYFPDKCLGADCATWAVTAVENLTKMTFERLGVTPNYQRITWNDSGLEQSG